jgi:predicted ATPase
MKIDVKVKNLGKIKEAEFKIRPMTVITGSNGTGKSFFTKSLYSILNIINKNVYHQSISQIIRVIRLQLQKFTKLLDHVSQFDTNYRDNIILDIDKLQNDLNSASGLKINDYFILTTSKLNAIKKTQDTYLYYINKIKSKAETNHAIILAKTIEGNFEILINHLKNPNNAYAELFSLQIENELKDNFQISSLNELISFEQTETEILVDNLLHINFSANNISLKLEDDFIDEVACLSSVVFFESPAYWKVKDALKMAKEKTASLLSSSQNRDDFLTGVPKYFYDLDDTLKIKTKTSGNFESVADSLEKVLGGEFIFEGDNLNFKDKETGREISKHLVSFGMTNLGMIHALLKHNIITEGSFVFIDEPETNLHPDWQLILMNALLSLAEKGVNIVITTHSTDILKSLEVGIKKRKIDDVNEFLSVHFVELEGELLKFESESSLQQLIEARNELNSTYEQLYFSDI